MKKKSLIAPIIDLVSSDEEDVKNEYNTINARTCEKEDDNEEIEIIGTKKEASSSTQTMVQSGIKRKTAVFVSSSVSSVNANSTNDHRPGLKRKNISSGKRSNSNRKPLAPRYGPLQAGIVLEEDLSETSKGRRNVDDDDDGNDKDESASSYIASQLDRTRRSLPTLLYHDTSFEPIPSSIDGMNTHSLILDDGDATAASIPKSKMEKCRCSPGQPAVLAFSAKPGPNFHRPYWTCDNNNTRGKSPCNYFKWAYQSHLMRWHRFGSHTGHVFVNSNGFRAQDLVQGKVGDCWFLSALAVVAERSDLIARLFGTMADINEYGIIEVRLFVDGYWKNIVIDNFLPCLVDDATERHLERAIQASLGAKTAIGMVDNLETASSSSSQDPHALSDSTLNVIRLTHEYLEQHRFKKNGPLPPGKRSPYSKVTRRLNNRSVQTQDLAYSKAKNNQLWVPILEKAYAKAHGCYKAISGGHISEAFLDLTGSPTIEYYFDAPSFNARRLWSDLIHFRLRKLPMGCGTSSSAAGIIGMHAYSILDVQEVKHVDIDFFRESMINGTHGNLSGFTEFDGSVRLLRIRNPHGKGEWKGDFSDGSKMWEKLLANRGTPLSDSGINSRGTFERTHQNDGTFWIDYDNFLMGFSNIDVVLAFEGHHAKSFHSNFPALKKSNHRCTRAFEVSLLDEQPGMPSNDHIELYVMGIQKNRRGSKHGRSDRKKSYKMCDLGMLVGKYAGGGLSAFESTHEECSDVKYEFDEVEGQMFGFTRNGHYRLVLDRKTCKSLVVMPLSFGHPAATDKELSYALRFVADAPVLITELKNVPRMDITLSKLLFSSQRPTINANIMGASRYRRQQGYKKIILDDKEGKRMHNEPLFRVFQIDYLGNNGGVVFVYLAVNNSLIERRGIKDFSISLNVEAKCRGMICRTADGLLQHETIAKGKKFEAAWRKYDASYDGMTKSRLLMVLVQSGASTEMGTITVKKIATRCGGLSRDNTLNAYLNVSESFKADLDDYEAYGIFNAVDFNDSSMFQQEAACRSEAVAIGTNVYVDPELEKAELQKAIELSSNLQHHQSHNFDRDLEAAIAASLLKPIKGTNRTTTRESADSEMSYSRDLQLAMKLSAQDKSCNINTVEVVDFLSLPAEKTSATCETNEDSINSSSLVEATRNGQDDVKASSIVPKENQTHVNTNDEITITEKRRLAAEAAMKRFT